MAHDVFISYSSCDKTVADSMCATLESRNIRCWIAPRDVPPGQPWTAAIVRAIGKSRVFVLILSSGSINSSHVLRELGEAMDKGIPAIPFRIDNVEPSKEMGYYIRGIHWLDAMTPPLKKHLQSLANTIQGLLAVEGAEKPPVGTPLVEPAEATAHRKPFPQFTLQTRAPLLVLVVLVFGILVLGGVGISLKKRGILRIPAWFSIGMSTPVPTTTAIATNTPSLAGGNGIPIIQSVTLRRDTSSGGLVIFQNIAFMDTDGDINRVDYEIVSATVSNLQIEGGSVDISSEMQKVGASITGKWDCGNENYSVTLRVTLTDKAGNQSKPFDYTMVCDDGGGPTPAVAFASPTEVSNWAINFEYNFPVPFWSVGTHHYTLTATCPSLPDFNRSFTYSFQVSDNAILFPEPIYLRLSGLVNSSGNTSAIDTINPGQATIGALTFHYATRSEIDKIAADCSASITWDGALLQMLVVQMPYQEAETVDNSQATLTSSAGTAILFQDNFSSAANGWETGKRSDKYGDLNREIIGGNYRMTLMSKQDYFFVVATVPSFSAKDFLFTIDTTILDTSATPGNLFLGFTIREANGVNGKRYAFSFYNDNSYTVDVWPNADYHNVKEIVKGDLETVKLEKGITNTFAIQSNGSDFTIHINGNKIDAFRDMTINEAGSMSLWLGLDISGQSVTVEFDNLTIQEIP